MGYYTDFSMTLYDATPKQKAAIMERLREEDIIGDAVDEELCCIDMATWYDEEEDMKRISSEFPTVHFEVHGEGQDRDDIWNHHYLGGKIQRCDAEITIPPFDPTQLE